MTTDSPRPSRSRSSSSSRSPRPSRPSAGGGASRPEPRGRSSGSASPERSRRPEGSSRPRFGGDGGSSSASRNPRTPRDPSERPRAPHAPQSGSYEGGGERRPSRSPRSEENYSSRPRFGGDGGSSSASRNPRTPRDPSERPRAPRAPRAPQSDSYEGGEKRRPSASSHGPRSSHSFYGSSRREETEEKNTFSEYRRPRPSFAPSSEEERPKRGSYEDKERVAGNLRSYTKFRSPHSPSGAEGSAKKKEPKNLKGKRNPLRQTHSKKEEGFPKQPKVIGGKQKRFLRGLGHDLEPVLMLGKEGITEGVVRAAAAQLLRHELIKVKIHPEAPESRQDAANILAEKTGAVLAQLLGRTFLLFKRNPQRPLISLPL